MTFEPLLQSAILLLLLFLLFVVVPFDRYGLRALRGGDEFDNDAFDLQRGDVVKDELVVLLLRLYELSFTHLCIVASRVFLLVLSLFTILDVRLFCKLSADEVCKVVVRVRAVCNGI